MFRINGKLYTENSTMQKKHSKKKSSLIDHLHTEKSNPEPRSTNQKFGPQSQPRMLHTRDEMELREIPAI